MIVSSLFRTLELQRSGTGREIASANIVTMSHRISLSTTTSTMSSHQHLHAHSRQPLHRSIFRTTTTAKLASGRQNKAARLLASTCRASKQSLHRNASDCVMVYTTLYIYSHSERKMSAVSSTRRGALHSYRTETSSSVSTSSEWSLQT